MKQKREFAKYYTKAFILRMRPQQYDGLKKEAISCKCSIASIIREAINERN